MGGPIISETLVISSRYVYVHTALALWTHFTNVSLESIAQMLLSSSFFWPHVLQILYSEESNVDIKWTWSVYVKNQHSYPLWGRNMAKLFCIFSNPSSGRNNDSKAKTQTFLSVSWHPVVPTNLTSGLKSYFYPSPTFHASVFDLMLEMRTKKPSLH